MQLGYGVVEEVRIVQIITAQGWWAVYRKGEDDDEFSSPLVCWALVEGATGERQRVEGSFVTVLSMAEIRDFRFHDLRHTFASWFMMNGGDLYELAKILGHANIKMTERYAKLAKKHIAKTGNTAREIWKLMEAEAGSNVQVGL